MRRGEIRWYKFQHPDKNRPVLILSRDPVIEYLGEVTIASVITTIRDIPSEVLLTKADGLPRECAVNCDHLQTVSKSNIGPLIATLSTSRMTEVAEAISFSLARTE
jgi:mRNA interferase MazF